MFFETLSRTTSKCCGVLVLVRSKHTTAQQRATYKGDPYHTTFNAITAFLKTPLAPLILFCTRIFAIACLLRRLSFALLVVSGATGTTFLATSLDLLIVSGATRTRARKTCWYCCYLVQNVSVCTVPTPIY